MQRRPELDALRGLMLVWMMLTHLPTIASAIANQPFGFFSGAEGFIFLSALFTGLIYYRMSQRRGYPKMRNRLWTRALRLYGYHALLLAFAFVFAVRFATHGSYPALYNLLDFYFIAGPKQAIIDAALLIYRPPLLDILPMYIIFLFLTPLALRTAQRAGWKIVLGASFAVWVAAQLGARQASYDFLTRHFEVRIPLGGMGSFDMWGWQFLWILGLYCGVRWARQDLPVQAWASRVVVPAAVIAVVLMVMRHVVGRGVDLGDFEVHFDKWHLGVVRLIDFTAVAALMIRFQSVLKPLAIRPLVMLGQASLQVFCSHILFCFLGLALMGEAERVTGWQQAALLVGTLSGLLLTAKIFARKDLEDRGQRPAPPLSVSAQIAMR